MDSEVTFVLTSCGRFDLLGETLASFFRVNRAPVARYVLIEDSGDESVRDVVAKHAPEFDILVNKDRLGQLRSIDRAYETVRTPFIFHCEDDWRFLRGGFIEESLRVLKNRPEVSAVLSRRTGQQKNHDRLYDASRTAAHEDIAFRLMSTELLPPWGGYSFNPSLVRVSDYKAAGPFSKFQHEAFVSQDYARRGMSVACLERHACETIGRKRHVSDPHAPRSWRKVFKRQSRPRENTLRGLLARWVAPRARAD